MTPRSKTCRVDRALKALEQADTLEDLTRNADVPDTLIDDAKTVIEALRRDAHAEIGAVATSLRTGGSDENA